MADSTPRAVILGGARTPFGKLNGALASLRAVDLGCHALKAAIDRSGVAPSDIENVILGQVLQGGAGQNPARQAALLAELDRTVPAETVNRVCGSGMRAITLADSLIPACEFSIVPAGGMDSMSQAPYHVRGARSGLRMGDGVFEDSMVGDGLSCSVAGCHMGMHGGSVAAEELVGREEQDAWALRSHQKAVAAADAGWTAEEIVPVEIADRKGTTVVDRDEAPRRDTSAEALAKLKPAF
ncbi:MAG TPA: acetyl-CoA C-acetyltransferase, partial [Thermomicrobiales bacterium]|nr:acetyl-CoA C-acetyltransferase [Thermomicrobiales bacterium]